MGDRDIEETIRDFEAVGRFRVDGHSSEWTGSHRQHPFVDRQQGKITKSQ